MKPRKQSITKKGFTLVELLVVMLILAILAAMIVPRIMSRGDDAKIAAAKGDIAALRKSLNLYYIDVGSYPTTDEGLEALDVAPSDATGWKGPYLDKPLTNDPWQFPYTYLSPGSEGENSFDLYSTGSDGQEGGTGNAEDIY